MPADVGAITDWVQRHGSLVDECIASLNKLSLQAERQEQFNAMRKLQEFANTFEQLMIVSGRRGKHDYIIHGAVHPIERRAMRHITVQSGQHWRWDGGYSADAVPVMSVPRGWPSPGVPHYDVSTGTTVVDDSYAPAEPLRHTNHTNMAVYRALWFVRLCNPKSPAYDPQAMLKPRQRLLKMCPFTGCVNPHHYQKQTASYVTTPATAPRTPAEVRALAGLPIYASDRATAHVSQQLGTGTTLNCRRGHKYEFDAESGNKLRCQACQAINNANRTQRKQHAYQMFRQRAETELQLSRATPGVHSEILNDDGSVLQFDSEGNLLLTKEEVAELSALQSNPAAIAAALSRAAGGITLPDDVHRPQGERSDLLPQQNASADLTPAPHTSVAPTSPPPMKSLEELKRDFAATTALFQYDPPTDTALALDGPLSGSNVGA